MWLCHPRRGSWDCLWPQLTKLHWNHPLRVMPFPEGGRAGERVDAAFHPQLYLSVPVMCGSRAQFIWHLLSDAGSPLRWFPIREQCCFPPTPALPTPGGRGDSAGQLWACRQMGTRPRRRPREPAPPARRTQPGPAPLGSGTAPVVAQPRAGLRCLTAWGSIATAAAFARVPVGFA